MVNSGNTIHFMCCNYISSPYYAIDRYGKNEVKRSCVIAPDGRVDTSEEENISNNVLLCMSLCKFLALQHSSAMRWTIPGKSYLGIRHITFHKLRTYLRSNGQVLLCCICLC